MEKFQIGKFKEDLKITLFPTVIVLMKQETNYVFNKLI